MKNGHIYIVDDHKDIRDLLGKYLNENGFITSFAENGRGLRTLIKSGTPDLVILDVMLPGEDGLSLCRFLRETLDVPIIMLTALSSETDKIVGLELGADDYLVKPFNLRELLARINSVLRRAQSVPRSKSHAIEGASIVRFDRWKLDVKARELIDENDTSYILSSAEYILLCVFLTHANTELNRDQLLEMTRGREAVLFDRSIDNMVSRLRTKLEKDVKKPELIKTNWGKGYVFCAEVVMS